jgi:hypothetical protein
MPVAGQRLKALDFPVAAESSDATAQSSIGTSNTVGSPSVSTTFIAPTSGRVQICLGMMCDGSAVNTVFLDWELRLNNVSGSIVSTIGLYERRLAIGVAASFGTQPNGSKSCIVSGLTPGQLYFIRTLHAAVSGGTASVYMRRLDVVPLAA